MIRDDDPRRCDTRSPVLYEKGMIPIYNTILFMSSGFFTGLEGGVRFTDSRFNAGGPLPTDMSSGPQGANGVADGIYTGTDQLLEGISPYAMPKQGSLNANKGPQTARRVAAGIPRVELPEPEPDSDSTFPCATPWTTATLPSSSRPPQPRSMHGSRRSPTPCKARSTSTPW